MGKKKKTELKCKLFVINKRSHFGGSAGTIGCEREGKKKRRGLQSLTKHAERQSGFGARQ